jgi:hypothetical protein
MEISQVVAVELHLCMRHGARRNFKATVKSHWESYDRVLSGSDRRQQKPHEPIVMTAYRAPGPLRFASDSARKRKTRRWVRHNVHRSITRTRSILPITD